MIETFFLILSGRNVTNTIEYVGHSYRDGMNTLGLVIFSIIMGITLSKMGPAGRPLLDLFTSLSEAMMIITNWVIWISPIGVTFLIASKLLEIKDIGAVAGVLGMYFFTVLLGLFIHGFGTLSVIYFVCTREMPFKSIARMSQGIIISLIFQFIFFNQLHFINYLFISSYGHCFWHGFQVIFILKFEF